jgi:D-beta-D-heptose 7-phosphate kinase/D-beta-D-heptose 1-phosphate adenosyltransferase
MNIQQQKKFNILLVGDSCTDVYQYGTVDRISPEAPVPIFSFLYQDDKPGMALNVQSNLEQLGCNVHIMTQTPSKKTRLIDRKTSQQMLRIDTDSISKTPFMFEEPIVGYDAVVVSDYKKGCVSYKTINSIQRYFDGPIYVDTKKTNLGNIDGCFVKINSQERNRVVSLCTELIVTMGKDGAQYNGDTYPANHVEVNDVCGAGDTFMAALVYFHLHTGNIKTAIHYANKAGSITVQHLGTYAPSIEEILL